MYARQSSMPSVPRRRKTLTYKLQPLPSAEQAEGHRFGVNKLIPLNGGAGESYILALMS